MFASIQRWQSMELAMPARTLTTAPRLALVVDADADVTGVLSSVLKSDEWDIVHVADNQTILKLTERGPFDLVITGAKTTGREDLDLLRKIRRVRPHVRFIILTDQSTPADVVSAMREGAFSFFSKPFSPASLAEMVRIAMSEPAWDDGIELVSATPEWISIIARCDLKTADRLVQFFNEMSDFPDPERNDVASAFREMLLNAIEHGGNFDPSQGFSLGEIHHAAINNPAYDPIRHALFRETQGLRPGGYGVLITTHLVDELVYSEKGNEVLLVKYLPPSPLSA